MNGKKYKGQWSMSLCENEVFCNMEFMNKDRIIHECSCVKKTTCLSIAELLKANKRNQATDLMILNFNKNEDESCID